VSRPYYRRGGWDTYNPRIIDMARRFSAGRGFLGWTILGSVLFLLFLLFSLGPEIYTDYLWYDNLGLASVFLIRFQARIGIFLIGTIAFLLLFLANAGIARALSPRGPATSWARGALSLPILVAGIILAAFMGLAAQGSWVRLLRYLNATPFGLKDPIFDQDISYYVFTLPVYRFVQSWLFTALVLILLATAIIYAISLGRFQLTQTVKGHLSALGSLILALVAWNYWLDIYELVYSPRGVVFGASYTDVNAQWGALTILAIIALACALLLLVNVFLRALRAIVFAVGAWVVAVVLLAQVYPSIVQNFQVKPSEFNKEKPYIEHNIRFTRLAYDLDSIQDVDYPAEDSPSAQDIQKSSDTIANIRLWDYRPLLQTYEQLQTIRPYYDFLDVDVDRYTIAGKYRQVMLSVRELAQEKLTDKAQTWINQRLIYTHGYGLAMTPVNDILPDGSPNLLVKNIPPVGELKFTRPEIYFGEKTDNYVIVNTKTKEFDYPLGEQNAFTTYQGQGGVALNSLVRRLAFALRFGDANIILTDAITPESRILFTRAISARVQEIAPFLLYDHDPYPVAVEGKIYWIQDAYTYSDRFPYSEPYHGRLNYIRNSVKVVIDAYQGQVTYYVVDEADPLIRAYRGIFPQLFQPASAIPAGIKAHFRYPEELFNIQAEMFRTYHMEDAQVFYNKEDLWAIPRETVQGKEQQMEAYYVLLRLPGSDKDEFMLMLPFTPANRQNLEAWLAAKSDGADYGKRVVFRFPKDKLVYGPAQVEARVNQDPVISGQLTLWSQAGSRVIRGNLLVIPIERSLLYIQPLYLLAERGQIPQLKRVIVAVSDRIAMEPTFQEALAKVFTGLPSAPPTLTTPAPAGDVAGLIQSANDHYNKAQEYLRAGDWARYGEEMKALEQDLKKLAELAPKK